MRFREVTVATVSALGVSGVGMYALAATSSDASLTASAPTPTTTTDAPRSAAAATPAVRDDLADLRATKLDRAQGSLQAAAHSARKAPRAPKKADKKKAAALAAAVSAGSDDPKAHLIRAYRGAVALVPASCRIRPELLAAIGQVESGNIGGRSLDAAHRVTPAIYGPPLTGGPFARIGDSDGGALDGSAAFDRAVGPMQFIPQTWRAFAIDGDKDGSAHPQNVYDAAATAARYLCAGGRDLSRPGDLRAAVLSYNYSSDYVATVLSWRDFFLRNGLEAIGQTASFVPNGPATAPTSSDDPTEEPRSSSTSTTPVRSPRSTPTSRPSPKTPTSTRPTSGPPRTTGPTSDPTTSNPTTSDPTPSETTSTETPSTDPTGSETTSPETSEPSVTDPPSSTVPAPAEGTESAGPTE